MTDETGPEEFADRVAALQGDRRDRPTRRPRPRGSLSRGVLVAAIALLLAGGVYFYEYAKQTRTASLAASEAVEFQDGTPLGAIRLPPAEETARPTPLRIELATPAAAATAAPDDDVLKDLRQALLDLRSRVDQFKAEPDPDTQRLLQEIRRQNEKLAKELAAAEEAHARALAHQRELMEAELDQKLMALRAELTPATAAAPEIDLEARRAEDERRRLEEEEARRLRELEAARQAELERQQKAARELAERQIESPAVVFDEGGTLGAGAQAGETPRRPRNANEQFAAAVGAERADTATAQPIAQPGRTVVEGTFLQGVLETAIDSSLPGGIRASITEDIWSFDGLSVLLPKGTRLIGTYRSDLSIAQERALVVWTRAITPDGLSVALASPGADRLGRAGVTGEVDTHFWERFGSAALISIIGAVPELVATSAGADNTVEETISDIGDDFRTGTSAVLAEYLRIQPTIHVDQGDQITVFVGRDLVIPAF